MSDIHILHLYPNEMNTYGDHGNVLALIRRLQWHGYTPIVNHHHPGSTLPKQVDIAIGGCGQDSAQTDVQKDILRLGERLHELAEAKVPMLMVCGTFQLFGHRYITHTGEEVKGISIFDAETIGGPVRMIGNVMAQSDYGRLYGFENHSGQTYLGPSQQPFGRVLRGKGNNGRDKTEGARSHNVFGTYLHGPFLPNNPHFCDELIKMAVVNRYGGFTPKSIEDSLVELARSAAHRRHY